MIKFIVILAMTGLLSVACGGGGEEQASQTGDETAAVESNEGGQVDTVEAVEETPVETATTLLYPEGTLDPSKVTVDAPVSAAALFASFYAWNGKKVTLEAYPYIPYMGDSMLVTDEIELIVEPGGSHDVLATAEFADSCGVTIYADQPITVSGTVEYYWTGDIKLVDCTIIDDAPPARRGFITSPYAYDGETPILVSEFFDIFNVWIGKDVTVEGYYHSTTTSTTDYGVTARVDLADPNDTYSKCVACKMLTEIPDATDSIMVANRAGTQIRGTVAGESFDIVGLENCEIVNR